MRFPPSFIERIRTHSLLSEVIGKRITLKKHGREYQACCPFHNEKTPSFTVNDEKNFYHCFGCGAHGDAIGFLMQHQRMSYPEAIETLARDAGIALPVQSPEERHRAQAEKTLYDVLEAACAWFEKQLRAPAYFTARDYAEKRGLSDETLRKFRIGYAPPDKTALHKHLLELGFSQKLQIEAGLIIAPDNGNVYDRFRSRLIFPIRNVSGKVVAFGGRLLDSDNKKLAKYLNSPETPVFKKGELLFNLDLAKRPARENNIAVVMEGYMDVVATTQSGIDYALATLGTAVTPEHLRLLWQLAKEPVICLDGDAAGKRAMLRGIEIALPLLKPGCSLRFAILPKGEDPDSYIQKHGKASFEKVLVSSKRLSQVIWETLLPQFKIDLPEGKAALENTLNQLAGKITDATVRQHYQSYFRKMLWEKKPTTQKHAATKQRSAHVERMAVQHYSAALETLTRRMLKTLIQFPSLLHKSSVEETLSRLDIRSSHMDALRNALLSAAGDTNIDDQAKFMDYMRSQLPVELLDGLLNDNLKLPYANTLTIDDALMLWNETADAYQISHLEFELKELQENLGNNMDEAAYQRLVELKQALDNAQRGRTFSSEASDVA
ncbi:MAG: DNA primase [Rickettsiales bacterium]